MQRRGNRKEDIYFVRWFLLKFVLPIILTLIGSGAIGNHFVNQEIKRGWARVDAFRDIAEAGETEECKDEHLHGNNQGNG